MSCACTCCDCDPLGWPVEDIDNWHRASGHEVPLRITLDTAVIERRRAMIIEEAGEVELVLRELRGTIIAADEGIPGSAPWIPELAADAAKELADLYWVTVGAMLELGLPMDEILQEVSASNWSKIRCPDCRHGYHPETDRRCTKCGGSGIKLERDENGKIRKGPNYRAANLGQIIADAMPGDE